jgi:hypothetical protein
VTIGTCRTGELVCVVCFFFKSEIYCTDQHKNIHDSSKLYVLVNCRQAWMEWNSVHLGQLSVGVTFHPGPPTVN